MTWRATSGRPYLKQCMAASGGEVYRMSLTPAAFTQGHANVLLAGWDSSTVNKGQNGSSCAEHGSCNSVVPFLELGDEQGALRGVDDAVDDPVHGHAGGGRRGGRRRLLVHSGEHRVAPRLPRPRGRPHTARHVIQRMLNPRFLSFLASYDVASKICPVLPSPAAATL